MSMSEHPEEEEERTFVGDIRSMRDLIGKSSKKEKAYLIVLAGPNTGEMIKVDRQLTLGRGKEVDVRLTDTETSRQHAQLLLSAEGVFVEDLQSTNGTFINGERIQRKVLKDGDKIQVGTTTILKFTYHDDMEEEFQRKMYDAALRDGLTQAFNKKYFATRLDSEFAFSQRHGTPLSLLLFDIDHFKLINDNHGHLGGDRVLADLAHEVITTIRREDIFARYGGEEFAVLCRGISRAGTTRLAERIRMAIEAGEFTYAERRIAVTVSIGVAINPSSSFNDPTTFIEAADRALYAAKRGGRNRIELFDDLPASP